jgi:hypothetical protein
VHGRGEAFPEGRVTDAGHGLSRKLWSSGEIGGFSVRGSEEKMTRGLVWYVSPSRIGS